MYEATPGSSAKTVCQMQIAGHYVYRGPEDSTLSEESGHNANGCGDALDRLLDSGALGRMALTRDLWLAVVEHDSRHQPHPEV